VGALGARAHPPPEAYSVTENSAKKHQNTSFSHTQNLKIFWGLGTVPSTANPFRGPDETPLHTLHPSSAQTLLPRPGPTARSWLRH